MGGTGFVRGAVDGNADGSYSGGSFLANELAV